jgi:transketolase
MTADLSELARKIRAHVVKMVAAANASHVGGCLSVADVLAALYGRAARVDPDRPTDPNRDRVILSKGHAAAALYAVLAERGFFPTANLTTYCADGSPLTGHCSHRVPGVELSTGSLGHGLNVGCGLALAARHAGADWRTFVVLSDGELNEGSVWEAALFAGHHRLDRLVAIVDANGWQSFGTTHETLETEPVAEKFAAFGWAVREVDGHDMAALESALTDLPMESDRPSAIIARTVKGKGVHFMENDLAWHYRSPSPEQLAAALAELEG